MPSPTRQYAAVYSPTNERSGTMRRPIDNNKQNSGFKQRQSCSLVWVVLFPVADVVCSMPNESLPWPGPIASEILPPGMLDLVTSRFPGRSQPGFDCTTSIPVRPELQVCRPLL